MSRLLFFMHTTSSIGGVETWLDRACAHFSEHGFEPVVGLVRGMKFNSPERYRRDHPDLATVEVDGRGCNREGRVRALAAAIEKVKPDMVLPLGIVDANEAVIRRKQRGQPVRLVGRAQGNLPPMLADLRLYRDWFDRVMCPGKLTRKMLLQWAGFAPERVLNISNGADEAFAERRPRREDGVLRLGYVGRLSQPDKRVLDLVPICRELVDRGVNFELEVVGDGPARAELAAGLAPFGARVRLRGAKAHAELYGEVFPALDVLLMTSASEAFGIVLVEAMMHGVVPVSSRYHGFHSEALVQDDRTGLSFAVADAAAAAAAVQRLQEDRALLDRLSLAARTHAQAYTWQNSLAQWQAALRQVAESPVVMAPARPAGLPVDPPGRLERLGVPAGAIDLLRRTRRAALGPAVQPGGEEWPLFHRVHSPALLEEIRQAILAVDAA